MASTLRAVDTRANASERERKREHTTAIMPAARTGTLAAVALILLCGAAVLGRPAPDDLCFADVRRTGMAPSRPLGPVLNLAASDLTSRVSVRAVDASRGCALALLDMAETVVPGGPRAADVVDVGWAYQDGDCMVPLAYRQYFNCTGARCPAKTSAPGSLRPASAVALEPPTTRSTGRR